ncbi:hypothetical protein [Sphingobacterium hungaricum]|uniref:Uncharacterized protein n=1 Tax=Sphingobacterium hungaricum TaxID=2082723 RepID=A0A928V1K2_9SPHI|nr:hypothetical protein [Sphingobacterium hungaricum]MBE8714969.1 hypothetical protein [Sphingobacterium hungaricum]
MKTLVTSILLIASFYTSYSQQVEIVSLYQDIKKDKVSDFYFLSEDFPLGSIPKIATLKSYYVYHRGPNIVKLFKAFRSFSHKLGANAYRVDTTSMSRDTIYTTITVYFLDDQEIEQNYELFPKNKTVIFGTIIGDKLAKEFKFDDKEYSIKPYTYYVLDNDEDGKSKLQTGKFSPSTETVKNRKDEGITYIAFERYSFGVTTTGGFVNPTFNRIGQSYLTRINYVDPELGQFLMQMLQENKFED